jgi:hypothetical protein
MTSHLHPELTLEEAQAFITAFHEAQLARRRIQSQGAQTMTDTQKPDALHLAEILENTGGPAHVYYAAGELRRLHAIEAEWMALSQDDGKAEREIERLHAENEELKWHLEMQKQIAENTQNLVGQKLVENGVLQAKLDALMLEHCPGEMKQEQKDEWSRHQVVAAWEAGTASACARGAIVTATDLLAENEALRLDAERYRWLRDHTYLDGEVNESLYVHVDMPEWPNRWALYGSDLDAAIAAHERKKNG